MRILIFGNSGSGKTTKACALAAEHRLPMLDLDTLAWGATAVRRPEDEARGLLRDFIASNEQWVIEGCYGGLIEAAAPHATQLIFMNPGVERCLENCRKRPWEPHKYSSREEQDSRLAFLLEWVAQYPTRDDEFSLKRHQAIFEAFDGEKEDVRG